MMGIAARDGGLSPGTWLGKHELIHRLAVGGMAEIYLARATGIEQFEKLLVLKRMLPQYAADHRFIRMFLDEARLAATLSHPNIAHVYDIGGSDGHYYFTMEYVHGADLATVLQVTRATGRPVPLNHALTMITGIAAGLHAAHEQRGPDGALLGVVHRDVSPSNILIGYDGSVKVVDFGIAKVAARHGATRTGGFMGKVRYASPEHVQGEPLDRRSDLFSLGALLYELTTGTRPFDGDSDFVVMHEIVHGDGPVPGRLPSDYPAGLEPIMMRALQRDRDARFATAQQLQLALEELARQHQLSLSSATLSSYMADLFGDKIAAWRDARDAGRSLSDHVIATLTGGTVDLTPAPHTPHAPRIEPSPIAPSTPAATPAASPPARRKWQRVGLGAGLLATALAIASAISSGSPASSSASAATVTTSPLTAPSPSPTAPSPAPISGSSNTVATARNDAPIVNSLTTPPARVTTPPARTRDNSGQRGASSRPRANRTPTSNTAQRTTPARLPGHHDNPQPWNPDSALEP